jgi:hypothetical protein
VYRSKHVEQLRNIGRINSTTRSHLVCYFYTIYIMMDGSMNIKFPKSNFLNQKAFDRTAFSFFLNLSSQREDWLIQ